MAARVWTGSFQMKEAVTVEIDGGVLTVTQSLVIVDGEGGANDDLVTIEFAPGFAKDGYQPPIYLKAAAGRTITVKHGTGNISLEAGSDYSLSGEKTKGFLRMDSEADFNDI
jgi:hypothetical protein